MAGKAYTMREMRAIVEYLTERKAYSELRGRKMWMEFANSDKTTRTWQSLKETFLKRILPDIQNPYYKLTMDQVRSFKQGIDVAEKEKSNRLAFRTASADLNEIQNNLPRTETDIGVPSASNVNNVQKNTNELPTTSIDEALEKATGEIITAAKIPSRCRSSADTLVLEYENAEDIQRDLESPQNIEKEGKCKSLKDKLTFEYSAPLTPAVRDLLDDFETESEASDKEPQSNIVEGLPSVDITDTEPVPIESEVRLPSEDELVNNEADSTIEINDSDKTTAEMNDENNTSLPNNTSPKDTTSIKDKANENIVEINLLDDNYENTNANNLKDQNRHENDISNTETNTKEATECVTKESNKILEKFSDVPKNDSNNIIANTGSSTQNTSSDTLLPNNQEALDDSSKQTQKTGCNKPKETVEKSKPNLKRPRIRSASRDSRDSKKHKSAEDISKEVENETSVSVIEIKDSPEQETSNFMKNTELTNTPIIEINNDNSTSHKETDNSTSNNKDTDNSTSNNKETDNSTSNKKENDKSVSKKEEHDPKIIIISEKNDKPSKNTDTKFPSTIINEEKQKADIKTKNPCLKSVSLFEEQFNNTKYSDSEHEDVVMSEQKQDARKSETVRESEKEIDNKNQAAIEEEVLEDKPQAATEENVNEEIVNKLPKQLLKKKETEDEPLIEAVKNEKADVSKKKETEVTVPEDVETDILDSGSECESQTQGAVNKVQHASTSGCLDRDRAMANVFGFAHGGVATSSRKRRMSQRKKSHHYRRHSKNISSNSSEWTSESDSDYISPPRGRRNRYTRKYLKPKRSRILQDPEEGMLYVVLGKSVYPLVKDGKHGMNYLTYRPDNESDAEESYWKQKYIEEKQRVEEVRKLLKQRGTTNVDESTLQPISRNSDAKSLQKAVQIGNAQGTVDPAVENNSEHKNEKIVLKISSKTGLEYCLEGGWNQISNAMPQLVKMMQCEAAPTSNAKSKANGGAESKVEVEEMEVRSGNSTPVLVTGPVDPEVQEKVNKIESEIFHKIEALDKENDGEGNEAESANVTKRKAVRRRNESSSSSIITTAKSPAKRLRTSKTISTDSKQSIRAKSKRVSKTNVNITAQDEAKNNDIEPPKTESKTASHQLDITEETEKPKRRTRNKKVNQDEPEKEINETKRKEADKTVTDSKSPSRSSSRLSKQRDLSESKSVVGENEGVGSRTSTRQLRTPKKYDTDSSTSEVKLRPAKTISKESTDLLGFDDDNVRFMFPPTEAPKTNKKSTGKKSLPDINIIPPRDGLTNSVDSTRGYVDSDTNSLKIVLPKRRRRVSFTARRQKSNRRLTRRTSLPIFLEQLSSDSNNSSYFIPQRRSLSINGSDFPFIGGKQRFPHSNLEKINELSPQVLHKSLSKICETNIRHFSSISKDSFKSNDNSRALIELGSSSNVSLPLSPELSVVEKLSISREMIKSNHHPTINEVQQNNRSGPMDYTDYMISNLDVSVPLMDQRCDLQKNTVNLTSKIQNKTDVVLKDCTVNLTLSKSLDQKMRDLLLESAQKMTRLDNIQIPMEVDQTPIATAKKTRTRNRKINVDMSMDVDQSKVEKTKMTRAKKRSSTPQKKKIAAKSKGPKDPIIEEEHMESCSYAGRKSCPPVMTFVPIDENANNCADVTLSAKTKNKNKKDIIKVKIQRPRDKSKSKEKLSEKSPRKATSTYTDSGINDTESLSQLKDDEDSVDLIHNHSETCLLANECMINSLEFVETSAMSIISLSSSRRSEDSAFFRMLEDAMVLSEETSIYRSNEDTEQIAPEDNFETADTVILSPVMSNSSLITEDLSNSPTAKPSKWYLLEEDITNPESTSNTSSFGANLKQIFPIACAVPNLSTISEMSKENEDSRKANLDSQ